MTPPNGKTTLGKLSNEIKTAQLVNALSQELDEDARRRGSKGILPLNGYAEKIYGVKLSDALKEVCRPLLDETVEDVDDIRMVFIFGIVAWNLAVLAKLAPEKFQENYDIIRSAAPAHRVKNWDRDMTLLIGRKQKLFPQIDMMLSDCKVVHEGNQYRLAVAGTPCDDIPAADLKKMFPEAFERAEKPSLWQKIRGCLGWNASGRDEPDLELPAPVQSNDSSSSEMIPPPELISPEDIFLSEEFESDDAMPSYREIFPSEPEITLFIGNRVLTVNDFYCLNPDCRCHESIVEFAVAETGEERELIFGVYAIDYQTLEWSIASGYPASAADIPLPVLRSMTENQIPDFYQTLEKRHKKLRQVFATRKQGTRSGSNRTAKKKKRKKNKR